MKKLVILPLIAATALGLSACSKSAPVDNGAAADVTLNSEGDLGDVNVTDETALGNSLDNVSALDTAENVTNSN